MLGSVCSDLYLVGETGIDTSFRHRGNYPLFPSYRLHWNLPWGRNPYWYLPSHLYLPEINAVSGPKTFPAGRINEDPSIGLSGSLRAAGFRLGRLQTGTPARLDGKTVNFTTLDRQDGDEDPAPFSFLNDAVPNAVRVKRWHFESHLIIVEKPSALLHD